MNSGNISILIEDLPVKQKYKFNAFLDSLSSNDKFSFTILHTKEKFVFSSYIVNKVIGIYSGDKTLYKHYIYDDIIKEIPNHIIDYFIGDYSTWQRIFRGIISENDMLEMFNDRFEIIKAKN